MKNLTVENLSFSYRSGKKSAEILKNVSFVLKEGEILSILGKSGIGKSTLLSILAGILPSNGAVRLGDPVLNPKFHTISYMPQNYGLLPWKNVWQNCILPFKIRKIPTNKAALNELLDKLKISDYIKRYPSKLSGGQLQRVALVRAICIRPDLLLMDEPFSALDLQLRNEAMSVFLDTIKSYNCSTIIVTHSLKEAMFLGDKIAVLNENSFSVTANPFIGSNQVSEEYLEFCKSLGLEYSYEFS